MRNGGGGAGFVTSTRRQGGSGPGGAARAAVVVATRHTRRKGHTAIVILIIPCCIALHIVTTRAPFLTFDPSSGETKSLSIVTETFLFIYLFDIKARAAHRYTRTRPFLSEIEYSNSRQLPTDVRTGNNLVVCGLMITSL